MASQDDWLIRLITQGPQPQKDPVVGPDDDWLTRVISQGPEPQGEYPCVCAVCQTLAHRRGGPPSTRAENWLHDNREDVVLRQQQLDQKGHNDALLSYMFKRLFGPVICNRALINLLASFAPLLNVNSGSAYVPYELHRHNVDIVATHSSIRGLPHNARPWTRINPMGPHQAIENYPRRNLLLLGLQDEDMLWAAEAVETTRGGHVLLVRDPNPNAFLLTRLDLVLAARGSLKHTQPLPNFRGENLCLQVWEVVSFPRSIPILC